MPTENTHLLSLPNPTVLRKEEIQQINRHYLTTGEKIGSAFYRLLFNIYM